MIKIELTPQRTRLLETSGHILVLGGPGSGKTTIALLKAQREIQRKSLASAQRILFLSFSRATVARVMEQVGKILPEEERRCIEINTYHGFSWNILRSHGYLLKSNRAMRLLPPPEASSRLAEISDAEKTNEKRRLFENEGLLHFDLFASMSVELLSRSKALAKIICDAYPIIILDEFQDTDSDEWEMVQILGKKSCLIALADPDQRIYEFRGADPKRMGDFIKVYSPSQFDFGTENNRSNGTDIVVFGNDLISGANKGKTYKDVEIIPYNLMSGNGAHLTLKTEVLQACKRLRDSGKDGWSIAVLTPSRNLMAEISYYLSEAQQLSSGAILPIVSHDVSLEGHAAALASVLIARVLEGSDSLERFSREFIEDLRNYILGRRGDEPIQADLSLALQLRNYLSSGKVRKGTILQRIIDDSMRIGTERMAVQLSGAPREDWVKIAHLLMKSKEAAIKKVIQDAAYLRLLNKGSVLSSRLSEIWRSGATYAGAREVVQDALVQEHFSASVKQWRGVNLMTIHKAKGKEFDEVFIYEGLYGGRIVYGETPTARDVAQSKLKLRVAVTRARQRTTILTPAKKVCPLLY